MHAGRVSPAGAIFIVRFVAWAVMPPRDPSLACLTGPPSFGTIDRVMHSCIALELLDLGYACPRDNAGSGVFDRQHTIL